MSDRRHVGVHRIAANAKLNLGLEVGPVRADGFHPIQSVFQSISLHDRLELSGASVDCVADWHRPDDPHAVVDGDANLAWRAVVALRDRTGVDQPLHLRLDKRIPVAAGLGGGSADAAAALWLTQRVLGADPSLVTHLAPELGSDVPFCVVGGTAVVAGRGEEVLPIPPRTGYAVALVVPPVEVSTPGVFAAWDGLGGPHGEPVPPAALPATLRDLGPLRNDLYPAALVVAPAIDEWHGTLEELWGRTVMMSGSGPSLFGFFSDVDAAAEAIAVTPASARHASVAVPTGAGWQWIADAGDHP